MQTAVKEGEDGSEHGGFRAAGGGLPSPGAVGPVLAAHAPPPRATQVRTALIIVAIVVGLIAWLVLAPAGTPGGSGSAGAAELGSSSTTATPVSQASTSTRGVTATSINVVFPVVAINSLAGKEGFAEDKEYNEQIPAIHLYVNQINNGGGINGRKINPIIAQFDPTNDAEMESLCRQWTQGSPAAFAVVDGIGTWEQDDQLCVTQQGQTPLLSAWSTTTNWTNLGSPYLWWTGPDMAPVLSAVVQWGMSSGRLGHGKKVGVVVSDQAPDQDALNGFLLPDLKKVGITPIVETVAGSTDQTATTNTDAQLAVEKFKAAGVQSVIPLLRENAFFPYIGAETSQQYYPQLLLSDYQSIDRGGAGPHPNSLREGAQRAGGRDDRDAGRHRRQPPRRARVATTRACAPATTRGTPTTPSRFRARSTTTSRSRDRFRPGAAPSGCSPPRPKDAGKDLNRRTFVEAMSKITNYPGTFSPTWSFGPNKFYGPTQYQVVKVHNNVPEVGTVQNAEERHRRRAPAG